VDIVTTRNNNLYLERMARPVGVSQWQRNRYGAWPRMS
jgi:hypothetical protein